MTAGKPRGLESCIWSGRLIGSGLREAVNPWPFGAHLLRREEA